MSTLSHRDYNGKGFKPYRRTSGQEAQVAGLLSCIHLGRICPVSGWGTWCLSSGEAVKEVRALGPSFLCSARMLSNTALSSESERTSRKFWARHQWLTPVILATQEAEIRRIEVRSQPGQIVHETLSRKKKKWITSFIPSFPQTLLLSILVTASSGPGEMEEQILILYM
jgi:hypothetical protein